MYNLRRQAFIAFLMMFAFAFATVRAEINATLKGRVVDAKTGEALLEPPYKCYKQERLP